MIKSVYSAVKAINKSVTFGISPASDMDYDYSTLYADVINGREMRDTLIISALKYISVLKTKTNRLCKQQRGGATMPRVPYILRFLCISQDLVTNTQGERQKRI